MRLLSCLPGRRRFDSNKLDRNLKMATSRLGIVANKYSTKLTTTRRTIEMELQTPTSTRSSTADDGGRLHLYCESLIRDEHYYTVMDLLTSLCQGLVGQLHSSTRKCPPHLLTTISTILYAALRLPVDIPELMVVRQQLRAKYGTKFVKEAEQNVNQTVRPEIVTKLNACHQVPKEMIDARVEVVRRHSTVSSSSKTSRGRTIESKDRTVSSSSSASSRARGSATRADSIENESVHEHHRPPPMNPAYQSENKKTFSVPTPSSSSSKANRQPLSPLFCNNNINQPKSNVRPCIPVKPVPPKRRPIPVGVVDDNDLSFMSPTLPIYIFRPNPDLEIAFDVRTKNPVYTLERLLSTNLNQTNNQQRRRRRASFSEELGLPPEYRSKLAHYRNSGYDRGHMAPAADFGDDTFTMTNVCPQVHSMNNSIWKRLEHWCRTVANNHHHDTTTTNVMTTLVVTGPLWLPSGGGDDDDDDDAKNWQYNFPAIGEKNGEATPVHVPTHFFKVVVVVDESNNIAKEICKFACFMVPNAKPVVKHNNKSSALVDHVVHWKTLETLSGLQFFPNLTTAAQWKEKAHSATNQVLHGDGQRRSSSGLQHLCAR